LRRIQIEYSFGSRDFSRCGQYLWVLAKTWIVNEAWGPATKKGMMWGERGSGVDAERRIYLSSELKETLSFICSYVLTSEKRVGNGG
jgi:hypothetical protein